MTVEGQRGPLAGRRVIEMASVRSSYCGKLLADLGADVLLVEPPQGDASRRIPPFWFDSPEPTRSLHFLYNNTNKRSITLNLAHQEGRELLLRLATTADLFIDSLSPGRLHSFGLGTEALRALRPKLVTLSFTHFGENGPYRDYIATDLISQAMGGVLYVTGEPGRAPVRLSGLQAYKMAGIFGAADSLIALLYADRTGEGQHIDLSVQDAVHAFTSLVGVSKHLDDGVVPGRSKQMPNHPSGTYPTSDGWVSIMIARPKHWDVLAAWIAEVTGDEAVLDPMFQGPPINRVMNRDVIDAYVTAFTVRFTKAELFREGQQRHLAFTPVNPAAEVMRDEQLKARNYFIDVEQRGIGQLQMAGAPYQLHGAPWRLTSRVPRPGEHTEQILVGELGFSQLDLQDLAGRGVV